MTDRWKDRLELSIIFIISAVALGFEIVLTLLFAAVLPANEVSLAIALALMGVASGGLWSALEDKNDDRRKTRLAFASFMIASTIIGGSALLLSVEFVNEPFAMVNEYGRVWTYLALSLPVLFLPFAAAGYVQASLLQSSGERFGLWYGADLVGAGAGLIGFPLLLPVLGLAGTLTALAVGAAIAGAMFVVRARRLSIATALLAVAAVTLTVVLSPFLTIRYETHTLRFVATRGKEIWSPITRVTTWMVGSLQYYVSGNSASLYEPHPFTDARQFSWTAPLETKSGGDVLVIASGAGAEVAAAHEFGPRSIDAVEISLPLVEEMRTTRGGEPGNPYDLPGVVLFAIDIRTFLARTDHKYDVIILRTKQSTSMLDQIAGSIATSYIHTEDAVADYLGALEPDGIFVFGTGCLAGRAELDNGLRWNDLAYARFISLLAGLEKHGVEELADHVLVFQGTSGLASDNTDLTALFSPTPFTPDRRGQLFRLLDARKAFRKIEIVFPNLDVSEYPNLVSSSTKARVVSELIAAIENDRPIPNFRTITDDRPYYFGSSLLGSNPSALAQAAGRRLRVSLLAVAMMLTVVLVLPLLMMRRPALAVLAPRDDLRPGGLPRARISRRLLAAMVLTGLGFIMVEIAGLARFQIFLGDPATTIVVVMGAMIVGAGLGSLHSHRVAADGKGVVTYALASALMAAGLFYGAEIGKSSLMAIPFASTIVVVGLGFAITGFFLGHMVPMSIRREVESRESAAHAWTITAATSTLGSVIADALVRDVGFGGVALVALSCYLLLATIELKALMK